ncbi:MAG: RNase P subunit p30 family protein, partial [Halorubrum sp.]
MYEAVHAYPDGEATVARHAATAARHGYDGIVVRTRDALRAADEDGSTSVDRDDAPVRDADALREEYGIDVVDAVEIDVGDPTSASGALGNYRTDRTVVCVVGGDDALNRFAVEQA